MKQNQQNTIFSQLLKKWNGKAMSASLLTALTVCLPLFILSWFFLSDYIIGIGILLLLTLGGFTFFLYQENKADLKKLLLFLDKDFPQLEFSSFLLLREQSTLNTLEKIQFQKVEKQYTALLNKVEIPVVINKKMGILVGGILFSIACGQLAPIYKKGDNQLASKEAPSVEPTIKTVQFQKDEIPTLEKANLKVTPPTYTKKKVNYSTDLNVSVPEQSNLQWQFSFNGAIKKAFLQFTNGTVLPLSVQQINGKDYWINGWLATSNAIYQLVFVDTQGKSYESSYYKIEIIEDKSPIITLERLPQYQAFEQGEEASFEVTAKAQDDYGISDAYMVATVSKGSGESVKFREERIELSNQFKIGAQNVSLSKKLDLYELGAEAGDELYFYLEVVDNKAPKPQKSRTETYFALLKDSTQEVVTVDGGLGVDFMPEYFRSQRQLIIDTEKLIAQRGKLSKKEFNETSNGIAYDQKVLRLRYGEFLGEEFESNIGGSVEVSSESNSNAHHDHEHDLGMHKHRISALIAEHAHLHDSQNEMERGVLDIKEKNHEGHQHGGHQNGGHQHGGNEVNSDGMVTLNNGAIVNEEYVHTHDSEESATFYFDATKAKLRAALYLMWESELHLRLNDPETALPVEYKILELLKEVQQKSRIYVERIGFEAPPIKESKRLQGELDEITSPNQSLNNGDEVILPSVRASIVVLENMRLAQRKAKEKEWDILRKAGAEVANLALEAPNKYLDLLRDLEYVLKEETILKEQFIIELQAQLLRMLPSEFNKQFSAPKSNSRLESLYIKELNSLP